MAQLTLSELKAFTGDNHSGLPMDAEQAYQALRPARMELGVRQATAVGCALYAKIGMAHATAWLRLTVNAADLYDIAILRFRSGKVTVLGESSDVYADTVASEATRLWCQICTERGW